MSQRIIYDISVVKWSKQYRGLVMAPATRRTCQYPGCNLGDDGAAYITMEGIQTQESVLKDLELHLSMAHTGQGAHSGGAGGLRF